MTPIPNMKEIYTENSAPRTCIFDYILGLFNMGPINVFQVGAIEEVEVRFRIWSGWSDFPFAYYINEYGGSLTICDINEEHLNNSRVALESFPEVTKNFILGDAKDYLNLLDYDLIYLDGANEEEETIEQFHLINRDKSVILIDDVDIKAPNVVKLDNFKILYDKITRLKMAYLDNRKII